MSRLLDYFVPANYHLDLKINREKGTLQGVVKITGVPKSDNIQLHAENLEIESVQLNGESIEYNYEAGILTIASNLQDKSFETMSQNRHDDFEASSPRDGGRERTGSQGFCLEIAYSTTLNTNMEGAYLSTYQYQGHTEKIVTTQFESHYARQAFPCIDEPAAKATFDLKITLEDYAPGDIILANTPVKDIDKNVAIFETTPKMSTYLLAFVAGKFHGKTIKNADGVEITTYAPLNQSLDSVDFANTVAAKSLEYYNQIFGIPYPLPKCDQVALPDFEAGAMENWGLVTYRESMLLADKTATLSTKKSITLTVAHELSHQWFGDLVTMKWWDDLWLNESFASVMEYYAADTIHPEYHIWEDFFTGDCLAALRRDAYFDVQSVHQNVESPAEIATLFDGAIVYAKGAHLMFMLIRTMGWKKFLQGMEQYFTKFAYQNTIGDNLWDSLQPHADFDVKDFMNSWIETPGFPVVSGTTKQRFLLSAMQTPSPIIESLAADPYPIVNLSDDMSGHYLINLSDTEFNQKLANFDSLNLEQKLRLLIDRSFLAKANLVPSASLLQLISKFKNEDSAAVWTIISYIVADLKIFFTPKSPEEKQFKNFINNLIQPKLSELGLKTRQDDTENQLRLRAILLGFNFYAENRQNLEQLAKFYQDDLTKLDPELRLDILMAKLYCEPEILESYLQKYQTESDPELKYDLLFTLTTTKSDANIQKLLPLLEDQTIIKPQDHLHFYIYLCRNHQARQFVLSWLMKNWNFVKKLAGDKTIEDYPRYTANLINNPQDAEKFFAFFDALKNEPALTRALKIAHSEIAARLDLIQKNRQSLFDELKHC